MFATVDAPGIDSPWPGGDAGPDTEPLVDLDLVPGARLALACQAAAAVPTLLSDAEVLDVVEGAERIVRWATAMRTRMLAEFAGRHPDGTSAPPPGADPSAAAPVSRWVPDEVGLTLDVTRLEALGEIAAARRFVDVLPDTLDALERGRIDLRRAEAISRATAVLPDGDARAVEAVILPKAPDATVRQVRDRLRRAVARVDPGGEHRRHRRAVADRRVSIRSLEDGMASLWFYGPAEQVEAAWQMGDRLARALGPEDPRTLDQRRFDLAAQILQGKLTVTDMSDVAAAVSPAPSARPGPGPEAEPAGPSAPAGPAEPSDVLTEAVVAALARRPDPDATVHRPLVHVVVGLDTLLGGDRPAELVGHGPVHADTARALAAGGVWARLVSDPRSGALLDHGRTTYNPPAGLADHVRSRDQVCRGPQCTRRIRDLDHHRPWARGGATSEPNLYGLCRHHHLLKDAPGWNVLAHPDRSLTWISPSGRRHRTAPYDYRRFTGTYPEVEGDGAGDAGDAAPAPGADDGPAPF